LLATLTSTSFLRGDGGFGGPSGPVKQPHAEPDRAPDLYIDNLGTTPAHQRRGIAAGLMDALIAWGKTQGCTYAWVATEIDNDGAKGFYAAQRFMHDSIAMFALEFD
jgi:aminoglycoside 6'-N-acetyltransferase I